eukprot:scaffold129807_cov35-Attheya_sp.AAC.1
MAQVLVHLTGSGKGAELGYWMVSSWASLTNPCKVLVMDSLMILSMDSWMFPLHAEFGNMMIERTETSKIVQKSFTYSKYAAVECDCAKETCFKIKNPVTTIFFKNAIDKFTCMVDIFFRLNDRLGSTKGQPTELGSCINT